jgi:hypothetical protein
MLLQELIHFVVIKSGNRYSRVREYRPTFSFQFLVCVSPQDAKKHTIVAVCARGKELWDATF